MTGQQLKNSILQMAIQGKLVPQDPNDEPASVLLEKIRKEKEQLVKDGKLKKKDLERTPISDDEKPFDIPETWEWARLGTVIILLSGQDLTPNRYFDTERGIPYITGASHFVNNSLIISRWTDSPTSISHLGELLITCKGTVGTMAYNNIGDIHIARQIMAINSILVYLPFVKFFLELNVEQLEKKAHSIIPGISRDVLLQSIIPLPPLEEQKRIVEKIEKLLPLVEKYGKSQEALNKLNAELPAKLKQSILQEAIQGKLVPQDPNDEPASVLLEKIRLEKENLVKAGKLKKKDLESTPISDDEKPFEIPKGWVIASLQELSLDSADGPFGSNLKKEHYTDNKEVRIIQLSNIGELGWKDSNVRYTTYKHLPNISRSEAFAGDIIIAKMMPAGRAIICPNSDNKYVLSSDAVRFNFSNRLYKKYLYYAINSSVFKDQVYGEVQGITRVRTSLNKLRTYFLPIPPYEEQKRIVSKIEELLSKIDKLA